MTLETFLPYAPYLALVYLIFAFAQAARRRRQSFGALLIALVAIAVPIFAYKISGDFAARLSVTTGLALTAAILFIASLVLRFYERHRRTPPSAYGIIGVGVSFVLAVALLVLPATQSTAGGLAQFFAAANNNGSLVNVAAVTPGANSQISDQAAGGETAVAQALTVQTGLSVGDLTTQISGGSTMAELVAAHNGDLSVVIKAITAALDDMQTQGGQLAQMFSSFGTDSTDIATKLANGQLPAQIQTILATQMITGSLPQAGAGGFAPPSGGSFAPPNGAAGTPDTSQSNSSGGFQPPAGFAALNQAQPTSTDVPTLTPSPTILRPTQIVFPTATITPEVAATEAVAAESAAVAGVSASGATCTLVIDYNLNLRDQPTQDGSTVLLSIPYGTVVTTTGRTADHWYSVTYDGKTGWVSGDYVTVAAACSQLPTLSG